MKIQITNKINMLERQRHGFIAMFALVLLIIFGVLGTSYWITSRASTDMIIKEAHRIKARSYAQAGIETVKINIANQYSMGVHNVEYPSKYVKGRVDKEYNIKFTDGEYKVLSVKPFESENHTYQNALHYSNGVVIGHYDVWEIKAIGRVNSTKIEAEVKSLVKVYRDYVSY